MATLRQGDKGAEVREAQGYLLSLGYNLGPTGADGDFGAKTYAAVVAFQQLNQLSATGVIDEDTLNALKVQAGNFTGVPAKGTASAQQRPPSGPMFPINWKLALAIGGGTIAVLMFLEYLRLKNYEGELAGASDDAREVNGSHTVVGKCRYGPPAASELKRGVSL